MHSKHYGDCHIYSLSGVCTCGLIHWALPKLAAGDPSVKHLDDDWIKHEINLARLAQLPPEPEMSDEEIECDCGNMTCPDCCCQCEDDLAEQEYAY